VPDLQGKDSPVTVTVGVVGTGMIGTEHVRRLATAVVGSRVGALFDVAADRASALAADVGARAAGSWPELVDDPGVDAVLVASPGELHAEQVLACLAAGKPVLCEKPLATTADDALKLVQAEVAAGRRLVQVGFMRRYDAGFRDVKAAIDGGVIGEPLLAHAVHRNPGVPDAFVGEMSLTDSLVHEFDTFRWLFGQEVVATTVIPVRQSPLGAAHLRDPQIVLLELANGAVVDAESFVNSRYGYDVRCEVVGSTGTVALDNPRTTVVLGDGRRGEAVPADWRVRFGQAYQDELQAWISALAAGQAVAPGASDAWDGYAAIAVAETAVASFAQGARTQVGLVEKPDLYARPDAREDVR
jgi:myo-inositol 2-dehydrogenase/D-chiro-inositol 1-dehydrogenase